MRETRGGRGDGCCRSVSAWGNEEVNVLFLLGDVGQRSVRGLYLSAYPARWFLVFLQGQSRPCFAPRQALTYPVTPPEMQTAAV